MARRAAPQPQDNPHDASPAVPDTFLGGLAAEDDSRPELGPAFVVLLAGARELLASYYEGVLADEVACELFSRLRAIDRDGVEWTVGATSLHWYRRGPGQGWSEVPWPSPEAVLVGSTEATVSEIRQEIRAIQAAALGKPADSGSLDAGLSPSGPFHGYGPGEQPAEVSVPTTPHEQGPAATVPTGLGAGSPDLLDGGSRVDAPATVDYDGPLAGLEPGPGRATGADPWAAIEGEADDDLLRRLLGPGDDT